MGAPRGDSAKTKQKILDAARRLFAEHGIASVSIRDIAGAAGVSHGLVQRYFGTREEMVAAIIRREIEEFSQAQIAVPSSSGDADFTVLRQQIVVGMQSFRDYARMVARAELAGVEPEKMLDPSTATPAMQLARAIANLQRRGQGEGGEHATRDAGQSHAAGAGMLDPRLVSAYVNASIFAFSIMHPWLMTSVGMRPDDFWDHLDEIAEISVRLVALASGLGTDRA